MATISAYLCVCVYDLQRFSLKEDVINIDRIAAHHCRYLVIRKPSKNLSVLHRKYELLIVAFMILISLRPPPPADSRS